MAKAKLRKGLKVLKDFRDQNGRPGFALRRWDGAGRQYVWVSVPSTAEELTTQLDTPVRLSSEPRYWLYRNRFVLDEAASSEPDDFVDLLETVVGNLSNEQRSPSSFWRTVEAMAGEIERSLVEAGTPLRVRGTDLHNMVAQAMRGIFPKRHSELANEYPEELVLRVKHALLSEERALDRLRREVEAFENFEKIRASKREPIPEAVRMFVWQRDNGCCVKCASNERLEYDHIIPLTLGGSNTERNIQLLCEACNRRKGVSI